MNRLTRLFGSKKSKNSILQNSIKIMPLFYELVKKELVDVSFINKSVLLQEILWKEKTNKFKENWMKNAYIYCRIKYPVYFKEYSEIKFYEIIPQEEKPPLIILSAIYDGKNAVFFK